MRMQENFIHRVSNRISRASMQSMLILAAFLFVTGQSSSAFAQSPAPVCAQSAQKFWQGFRDAVNTNALDKLRPSVAIPFFIRGTLDSSPRRRFTSFKAVKAQIPALLEVDPGLSASTSTMANLIAGKDQLSARDCTAGGRQFRVGNWRFVLRNNVWRFVEAMSE